LYKNKKDAQIKKLVKIEWDIMRDLKRTLKKPELSVNEKARIANALAYHAGVINKLLAQQGETPQFNEATLGDFIQDIEPGVRTLVRRDFNTWMKRLSARK
jgi:hypothetical protein